MLIDQCPAQHFELSCLPASWHNYPQKIVPGIKRKVEAARKAGKTPLVVYGDCGTGGALDTYLQTAGVERIEGPHCYEIYLGKTDFEAEMDQALGTFFLTDYMVRHFERIIMKGMGLRQHPQLRDTYFAHYTRVLYIAQSEDAALQAKARAAAEALGLAYEYRYTGFGDFASFVTHRSAPEMSGRNGCVNPRS
jgi:hypothetical protein